MAKAAQAIGVTRKIAVKSAHVVALGEAAIHEQIEVNLAKADDRIIAVMGEKMLAREP